MSQDLIISPEVNAVQVFGVEGGSEPIIEQVKKMVENIDRDISTEQGRKNIASVAYKIARTKTALDEEGKTLKSEMQKTVDLVDAERKKIRDALDALKDDFRKPLTDWEEAEKKRVKDLEDRILTIKSLPDFGPGVDATVEQIDGRVAQLEDLKTYQWDEFVMRSQSAIDEARSALLKMRDSRLKRDEEAAELARLRKEQEERERQEREAKIAQEAAEKAKIEAEQKAAQEAQALKEKAEKDRQEAEAAAEAERKAREDAEARAAKAEEDAKKAAQIERERIEKERQRLAEADAARAADTEHRKKINNEALSVIQGIIDELSDQGRTGEEIAKKVVSWIAQDKVPNVKIIY